MKGPMLARARLALAATSLALLIVPSVSTAATPPPFVAKLKNTVCTHTGSSNGLGTLNTTAQMTENGRNGTNYMVIRGAMQRRSGASWTTYYAYPDRYTSPTFANNASSHTHVQGWFWPFRN